MQGVLFTETSIIIIFCLLELLGFFAVCLTGVWILKLGLLLVDSLSFFSFLLSHNWAFSTLSPGERALVMWDRSWSLLSRVPEGHNLSPAWHTLVPIWIAGDIGTLDLTVCLSLDFPKNRAGDASLSAGSLFRRWFLNAGIIEWPLGKAWDRIWKRLNRYLRETARAHRSCPAQLPLASRQPMEWNGAQNVECYKTYHSALTLKLKKKSSSLATFISTVLSLEVDLENCQGPGTERPTRDLVCCSVLMTQQ